MEILDAYRTLAAPSEGLYKEAGSRFIAFALPVRTEEDIRSAVERLRREYHDARHVCYAWRLAEVSGDAGAPTLDLSSRWRANDDGEPSGTAGRQILSRIDSAGLNDILVAVVRYFGGVKLGVPGLIKAYRTATDDALSSVESMETVAARSWRIGFEYGQMPAVMNEIKILGLEVSARGFEASCSLQLRVRLQKEQDFLERMEKIGIFKNKIEML